MTSMGGSANEQVDDHAPFWKYATKVEKLEGEEKIGDRSVVIALKYLMDHIQRSRSSHVDKRIRN